jgi:hypothetical protein
MFGQTFAHGTLRKYVILFGTLFNDVWVNRKDAAGNVKSSLKVPLSYGPREKFLARIEGLDADLDPQEQPFAITLPRMGFEITGFSYAPERKLSTINRFVTKPSNTNEDQKRYQYNPVPYDIQFSLSIFVKSVDDGTQIIEQILPFFTPEWTTTVQLISDPDITLDIPLVLTGTTQDDVYEGSFDERRSLIFTFDYTMKGFFFGPTKKSGVIKLANTQLYDATLFTDIEDAFGNTDVITRITVSPGQTAAGAATSNAAISVSSDNISSDENYGYIVDIDETFPDDGV